MRYIIRQKVQEGDSVAVFGLGRLVLAVVQVRVSQKAGRIIAIDTNPAKFELAKQFGATDCLNPNDYDKPIKDVLLTSINGVLTILLNVSAM